MSSKNVPEGYRVSSDPTEFVLTSTGKILQCATARGTCCVWGSELGAKVSVIPIDCFHELGLSFVEKGLSEYQVREGEEECLFVDSDHIATFYDGQEWVYWHYIFDERKNGSLVMLAEWINKHPGSKFTYLRTVAPQPGKLVAR